MVKDLVGIYMIICLVNGKRYIEQSVHLKRRMNEHKINSSNSGLRNDIDLYGWKKFRVEILEECAPEELIAREDFYEKLCRKIRCVETEEIFPSIKAAAEHYGLNDSNISVVLTRKRKTCGGYRWE